MAKVRETLKEIGYPEDEFAFDWFSISGEEYAQMEQEALAEELWNRDMKIRRMDGSGQQL